MSQTILFTKKLDEASVSQKLGNAISCDFKEVIKIHHNQIAPFDLKGYSILFTSVNGVRSFFENGFQLNENFTESYYNKVYAVGNKTKQELRKRGFGTFKVLNYASELSEFITEHSVHEKFLHFCGNLSLDVLDRALPLQNIWYKKIELYQTELLYPKFEQDYSALVFFSPSGVCSYLKNNSLENKTLFAIGTTTEKELKNHTEQPIYISPKADLDELLDVIKERLSLN